MDFISNIKTLFLLAAVISLMFLYGCGNPSVTASVTPSDSVEPAQAPADTGSVVAEGGETNTPVTGNEEGKTADRQKDNSQTSAQKSGSGTKDISSGTVSTSKAVEKDTPKTTTKATSTAPADQQKKMTDAQKSEMEAKQKEREAALEEEYEALTPELKAIVDEIRASYNGNTKDMTDEQKADIKAKQDAVTAKIKALSETDQKAIADFLPHTGRGRPDGAATEGGTPDSGTGTDTSNTTS